MKRVLIIDDSVFARATLRRMLERGAYEVAEAESGVQALELVRPSPPDVITLDLLMPGMEGLELLGHLRAACPDAKFIVITADVQRATREALMAAGAHAFLGKPQQADELLAAVKQVLSSD